MIRSQAYHDLSRVAEVRVVTDAAARPSSAEATRLVVRPPGRTGRWVVAIIVTMLLAFAVRSAIVNPNFQWPVVGHYLFDPFILSGLLRTIALTMITMAVGIVLGGGVALMRASANPILSLAARLYLWIFRGTPLLVQLLFWYNLAALYPRYDVGIPFLAPSLLQGSVNSLITPYVAASLGLGLNEAAYMAEIIRAGLGAVDPGQREAARALGMRSGQIMRRIVLPQAVPFMIPPIGNEMIGALKTTSLVSVIALSDLLYSAQTIYSRTFQTIPLLIVACFWYLLVTSVLGAAQHRLEHLQPHRRVRR
ncbi:MAG: amino acid ABC transporter permease [Janthinobacterium lividum]